MQQASTIAEFSKYLRMNTDALSKTEPVSVTEEINHAMAYSKIEMISCDSYEYLKGNKKYKNAYHGEYMIQYPWTDMELYRFY